MKRFQIIELDVFRQKILVWYGVDEKVFIRELRGFLDSQEVSFDDDSIGRAGHLARGDNNCWYVWTKYKSMSTLVHELSHFVYFFMEHFGMKEVEVNEMFSYLLEYCVESVTKKDKPIN